MINYDSSVNKKSKDVPVPAVKDSHVKQIHEHYSYLFQSSKEVKLCPLHKFYGDVSADYYEERNV
jgi:hypothetical protein